MFEKGARILQHLILCKKQIHVIVHCNITVLPEPEHYSRRKQYKAYDRKEKPVSGKPHKPLMLHQISHKTTVTLHSESPAALFGHSYAPCFDSRLPVRNTNSFCPKKFITMKRHIPRTMATLSTTTGGCAESR